MKQLWNYREKMKHLCIDSGFMDYFILCISIIFQTEEQFFFLPVTTTKSDTDTGMSNLLGINQSGTSWNILCSSV